MADQKKTYTVTTATTPARPRSKARRDGMGLTSGGASAIIESATAGNAQRASHANTADEAAHALRADEAAQAATAKTAEHATTADRADEATHAATATNATTADHANTADTATRAQSAQTADRAATAARADQAQRATEAETLRTPNYSDGLNTGAGARIDAMGNAEFQSMAVRGFFRAAEYQINRIALSEGDVFHTENGLVKSAEQQSDGRWKVVLQERFQGDVTGFRAGDILRGAYNSVGTSGGSAEIRTSWLRVEAVDAQAGTLTASLYADNQTPEGRNAPPVSLMRLARWGNTTDTERQSHIMESATDGRIVRRVKVSAPIVDGAQSDGFVVGKLPAWLREHFGAAVAGASDYVFARGIITQNILRYTPAGRPLAERVDRGLWSASSRYFYEEQNPETGAFEISRVWHDGALYELARGGNGNTAPAAQSTHWTLIQAKPKDGDAGKSAPPTGANLIDGTSFRSMEDVRNWKGFERFAFNQSQEDKVHPLAQAVGAHRDGSWLQGLLYVASLLRPNTTYTLSVYSKGAQGVLVLWSLSASTNRDTLCTNADPNKWARYSYTFTTPDTIPNGVVIALRCMNGNAKTYFSALKLEEGETATPWCLSEKDKKGDPGKSSYTHVAYSNSPDGNPCTLDPRGEKFAYLGTYTDETPDASPDPARYVWAKVQGDKGDNGRGVSRMRAFYMLTTERDAPQPDTSEWTETAPQPTKERPWLWSYERSEYSDGAADQTVVRLIGHYGKDGTNGTSIRAQYSADAQTWHDDFAEGDVWMRTGNGTTWGGALRVVGESGTDGKSPVYDFAASSQLATASGTTAPTIRGTWQDAPPTLRDGEVLWYRLTAANGKITYGRLSGEKGKQGAPGDKGDSGRGIDRIETFYLLTPDGTAPGYDVRGWGNTATVPTLQKPWLWTYERVVYSDGTSVRTPVRLDTRLAKDGADAEPMRPNLLDDTDFQQLGRKESAWKIGIYGVEPIAGRANISIFSSAVDGCVPAICAINPGTKEGEFAHIYQNVGQLIPGRTYTFSVYVRGADVAWLIVYPTPAEHFHPNTVKQDGWTRVSLSFRASAVQDPDGVLLLLRAWHREAMPHTGYAKNVVWCAPKLEEGNRATQWCPSFRDQRGADGSPGVRGAAVRQLGDYDRLPDGTTFESGHAGETYLDVVQVRQGEQVQFYQCKQPHTKSADKAPAADSEWWELGMYQGFIATDLLLAERSLIKNLQVENVVGRDANGNTTFDLDASTGTAYFGGTATFAGFIRRRPVVITPENWKGYGGELEDGVIYLDPFRVGTFVIFRGDFGALRPTINTGGSPLGVPKGETPDNSQIMRYYGAQFMVFNDLEPRPGTLLTVGALTIGSKRTAVFTMLGYSRRNPTLWWKGEIVGSW